MNIATLARLSSAAVVTGIATIAFASPAGAEVADPPGYGSDGSGSTGSATPSGGVNWIEITEGTAGGLVVVGAGVATVLTVRRHRAQPHAA
jgi:hypothetical protein